MQALGSCLVILGVVCFFGGRLLEYMDDTATIDLWDKLRFVGLGTAGLGVVVLGLALVVGML